jgi:hypothetical protein
MLVHHVRLPLRYEPSLISSACEQCTTQEQLSEIRCLKTREMLVQHGDNYMSLGKICKWMERFKEWSVLDNACSGRSLTVTCADVKDRIDQSVRENPRIALTKITSFMERGGAGMA